jgi:hypothetical protein
MPAGSHPYIVGVNSCLSRRPVYRSRPRIAIDAGAERLRHGWASVVLQLGGDSTLKFVSNNHGHTTSSFTLDTCAFPDRTALPPSSHRSIRSSTGRSLTNRLTPPVQQVAQAARIRVQTRMPARQFWLLKPKGRRFKSCPRNQPSLDLSRWKQRLIHFWSSLAR